MILHFLSLLPIQYHPCTPGKSGCRIVSKNSQPLLPILRSLYPLVRASAGCGRSFLLAVWKFRLLLQPLVISSLPSNLMAKPARLPRDPPYRLIHETAATLSPLNIIRSPGVCGLSCEMTCVTYAVITMPQSSSRLIMITSTPFVTIWFLNSSVRWGFRSYLQYTRSSLGKIHRLQ